jgi:L-fuconolactonase
VVIDAHQHFWRIGEHDCAWPTPDLAKIYRHFMPVDLEPLTEAAGVTGTVLVQSQASDLDTDFLLRVANETSLVKAVVGWVDLSSPSAVARIQHVAAHPKMRGLRPMLQNLPQDNWILSAGLEPAIAAMQACNLSFDALVRVHQLPYLHTFAKRHANLPMVVDHAAKPDIAASEFAEWSSGLADMAKLPQVFCKLSGLLTEANVQQGLAQLRPYVVHLYHLFGAERLMWGSDWPVLTLAPNSVYAHYGGWLALAKQLLPIASARELEAIFGLTATRFYRF